MSERQSELNVSIIGLGLIGGSIGMALKANSPQIHVAGWDISNGSRDQAFHLGAVDRADVSLSAVVASADLVVIATPVTVTLDLLTSISLHLKSTAIVTDTGSTKLRIVEAAEEVLPGRFVGGHPMAGSEISGLAGSRANLFKDANWLLTPTSTTLAESVSVAERLVRCCGAIPRICAADVHDRMVAALSHLPHIVAWELGIAAHDLVPTEFRDVAAGSFKDGTRVGHSDPAHWAKILLDNRTEVLHSLALADSWRKEVAQAIEANDLALLTDLLKSARTNLSDFPKR
ncbi:MAG: prephenate dehydrogenase/arogenate dehydrogenase family protein [Chthonomonadales bacterium]